MACSLSIEFLLFCCPDSRAVLLKCFSGGLRLILHPKSLVSGGTQQHKSRKRVKVSSDGPLFISNVVKIGMILLIKSKR